MHQAKDYINSNKETESKMPRARRRILNRKGCVVKVLAVVTVETGHAPVKKNRAGDFPGGQRLRLSSQPRRPRFDPG